MEAIKLKVAQIENGLAQVSNESVEHKYGISCLSDNMLKLTELAEESNKELRAINLGLAKQEPLSNKLAEAITTMKEANVLVNKRIDTLEDRLEYTTHNGCPALQLAKKGLDDGNDATGLLLEALGKRIDTNDKHKTYLVLGILTAIGTAIFNTLVKLGS